MKRNSVAPIAGKTPLNPVEAEVIHLFVQLSRALNQPPSVAEIYGLLFVSPRPLPQDEFGQRLNLSKGTASQGLGYLMDLGAVRTVYMAGDRRVHYQAVAELRHLVERFMSQRILPYFEDSGTRLERIAENAQSLTGESRKHALARIKLLQSCIRATTALVIHWIRCWKRRGNWRMIQASFFALSAAAANLNASDNGPKTGKGTRCVFRISRWSALPRPCRRRTST